MTAVLFALVVLIGPAASATPTSISTMPNVDMIGPSDMKVNRRRRAGASGVPASIHGRKV